MRGFSIANKLPRQTDDAAPDKLGKAYHAAMFWKNSVTRMATAALANVPTK